MAICVRTLCFLVFNCFGVGRCGVPPLRGEARIATPKCAFSSSEASVWSVAYFVEMCHNVSLLDVEMRMKVCDSAEGGLAPYKKLGYILRAF